MWDHFPSSGLIYLCIDCGLGRKNFSSVPSVDLLSIKILEFISEFVWKVVDKARSKEGVEATFILKSLGLGVNRKIYYFITINGGCSLYGPVRSDFDEARVI